ncbi:uncharacterized protein ACNLHF_011600 isoform 1-T4 [Anomaloglossus baeobatrachus]
MILKKLHSERFDDLGLNSETERQAISILEALEQESHSSTAALKDLNLFSRKMILKKLHSKWFDDLGLNSETERQAISILEALEQESHSSTAVSMFLSLFILHTLEE